MATTYFPERYTNANETTVAVGGIAAGETFSVESPADVFNRMFYPYQSPTFSAFAITGVSTLECGRNLLDWAGNPVNYPFTWSTTNSSNVATNSISIIDVTTGNVYMASGLANDGSQSVSYNSSVTRATPGAHQFKIQATDTQSVSFEKTLNIAWQWKRYYGESASATLNEAGIEGLRVGELSSVAAGTYAFQATSGYKYICSPFTLTTFKDNATQLPVPFETGYTVLVTNAYIAVVNYYIYRSTNVLNGAITVVAS